MRETRIERTKYANTGMCEKREDTAQRERVLAGAMLVSGMKVSRLERETTEYGWLPLSNRYQGTKREGNKCKEIGEHNWLPQSRIVYTVQLERQNNRVNDIKARVQELRMLPWNHRV